MAPSGPRLRILSVGGNAVSAFLSWRLQATNSCDVTLVWKNGFQAVAQYGISFKSSEFGNERFKPRHVVQSTEDAATREAAFDYVLLCVKALPDVYDLASIIQPVVTPQHTCVIVNTTNTLGVEQHLAEAFSNNVVLSLVSGADLSQQGASEFEHTGSTDIWVGTASSGSTVPESISKDMSDALAMTLTSSQVDCKVSPNIRQQQYERMIGPIAFQPASVIFETASMPDLVEKAGVRDLLNGIIDELLQIAATFECSFSPDFKERTFQRMISLAPEANTMYQDFLAKRPMEIETYLGTPLKFAREAGQQVPRLHTMYAMLHHLNSTNHNRPAMPPTGPNLPRVTSAPPMPRPPMNGPGRGGRMASGMSMQMMPPARRGGPTFNGPRGPPNGYPPRPVPRRPSQEEHNLDDFSHVVLYDDIPEGEIATNPGDVAANGASHPNLDLRERELMLRQRELRVREQEMSMRRPPGSRRSSRAQRRDFDLDDDDDDYIDPMDPAGPPAPQIDPDNFDMMSVTSRRTRKTPSQAQLRKSVYDGSGGSGGSLRGGGFFSRVHLGRNRASTRIINDVTAGLHDNLMDNPMMGYSSNRYGAVDRKELHEESRANSLTASRMHEGGPSGGPYPGPPNRRTSQSPGHPFGPMGRGMGRPPPMEDGQSSVNGMAQVNGRPSPPAGTVAPSPRHVPGMGKSGQPLAVEPQGGVSKPSLSSKGASKSLTGSASASAGSGDSGSGHLDSSEPSAHSSQSSFAPRLTAGAGPR